MELQCILLVKKLLKRIIFGCYMLRVIKYIILEALSIVCL
jgi:hypothetical protein